MTCPITRYDYVTNVNTSFNISAYFFNNTGRWLISAPNRSPPVWKEITNPDRTEIFIIDTDETLESGVVDFKGDVRNPPIYYLSTYVFENPLQGTPVTLTKDISSLGIPPEYYPQFQSGCCGNIKDQGPCPIENSTYQSSSDTSFVGVYNMPNNKALWFSVLASPSVDGTPTVMKFMLLNNKADNRITAYDSLRSLYYRYSIDFTKQGNNPGFPYVRQYSSQENNFPPPAEPNATYNDFVASGIPDIYGAEMCCIPSLMTSNMSNMNNMRLNRSSDGNSRKNYLLYALIFLIVILFALFVYKMFKKNIY